MDIEMSKVWTITYTFRDGGKGKSSVTLYFPATAIDPNDPDPVDPLPEPISIAHVKDWAEEMAHKMDAMTLAGIECYTLSWKATNDDYEKPPKDVDVEEKGEFVFRCQAGFRTSVSIPAIDEDMLDEDGETIDTSATALRAHTFINAMVDPWGPDLYEPCDSRGYDIIGFIQADKKHTGSQKNKTRKG